MTNIQSYIVDRLFKIIHLFYIATSKIKFIDPIFFRDGSFLQFCTLRISNCTQFVYTINGPTIQIAGLVWDLGSHLSRNLYHKLHIQKEFAWAPFGPRGTGESTTTQVYLSFEIGWEHNFKISTPTPKTLMEHNSTNWKTKQKTDD